MDLRPDYISLEYVAKKLELRKKSGENPFVLFLGPCCSVSSLNKKWASGVDKFLVDMSVPLSKLETIDDFQRIDLFYSKLGEWPQNDRFDWFSIILENSKISPGFHALTDLLCNGYFDMILTTSVDWILDKALQNEPKLFAKYYTWNVAEHSADTIIKSLDHKNPRINIIKLHGDIKARNSLLSDEETFQLPIDIEKALSSLLHKRDLIMLGFQHLSRDVIRLFIKNNKNTLINIHPNFRMDLYQKDLIPAYEFFKFVKQSDSKFDRFFKKTNE